MAAGRRNRRALEYGETTARVLAAIDPDTGEAICSFLDEPLVATEDLAELTRVYFKQLESLAETGEEIDLDRVIELAVRCERLLDELDDSMPEDHQRLIQAAIRYFVDNEDVDGDLDMVNGINDDGSVIEAVALTLGMPQVLASTDD